jgi:hypothetical protein
MIETVRGGMMPLDDHPLQKGDQTYAARSGATFGLGTRSSPQEGNGEAVVVEGAENSNPTMAWLVTDERGKYLLVAPAALDSFELASKIARSMHGEFMIEMLTSGSLTACDEPAAPGWRVMLEPILNADEAAPHFN